ncbi:MAG: aminotransferase [Acidobacteria bacterium]|nr:MAG: aminotransferase [Acidobacteriota bacterium]
MLSTRIAHMREYPFAAKLRKCREIERSGGHVIDLGIGSPDLKPPRAVIQSLKHHIDDPDCHRYQKSRGILEFREAVAQWYHKHYHVELNPEKHILPVIGSKQSVYLISLCYIEPGDQVLIPNPGYLNYKASTLLASGIPIPYSLQEQSNWYPDFAKLEQMDLDRVKLLWMNYPHMPTGASGCTELFEEAVQFAKKHDILICHDNPYGLLTSREPVSPLQIEGALQHCLELNSFSKTYHMAGWRLGMICGSSSHIEPLFHLFSHLHSGQFLPIQKAAITALEVSSTWREEQNVILEKRRALVEEIFKLLHFRIPEGQTGLYVWAEAPSRISDVDLFLDQLLTQRHLFLSPGSMFGSNGKRYARASLCLEQSHIKTAIQRLTNHPFTESNRQL